MGFLKDVFDASLVGQRAQRLRDIDYEHQKDLEERARRNRKLSDVVVEVINKPDAINRMYNETGNVDMEALRKASPITETYGDMNVEDAKVLAPFIKSVTPDAQIQKKTIWQNLSNPKETSEVWKPGYGPYDASLVKPVQPNSRVPADVKMANDLRKEFLGLQEVKDYQAVSTQVGAMESLLDNAKKGNLQNQLALDQALITMYNKLTDPQSVVRESEYARTPENLSLINRVTGSIEKLKQGGAGLTLEDREALVLGAKIIANERGKQYNKRHGEYTALSNDYQIDPKLTTGTRQPFREYSIGGNPPPSQIVQVRSIEEANALPVGTKFSLNGRTGTVK